MTSRLPAHQARRLALALAATRVGLGAIAVFVPDVALRPWIGSGGEPQRALLGRSLGARDLALGLGALLAARHDAPLRGWIEAGGLSDTGDTVATLASWRHLPSRGRVLLLLASAGAAATAAVAAPSL
jgi:hypothetical protein